MLKNISVLRKSFFGNKKKNQVEENLRQRAKTNYG